MNVKKSSFSSILLLMAVNIFSSNCLPDYVDYTLSVIEHLDRSQAGTFRCIFMNLNKAGQSESDVGDLLKSLMSRSITTYIINGSFEVILSNDGVYGEVPVKPSLIVVYLGDHGMQKESYGQVYDNFKILDTNSKVLVIGNLNDPYSIAYVFQILKVQRFNLVVYLGIGSIKVIRFSYNNKITAKLHQFPDPANLFEENARNIRGNYFYFAVFQEEDYHHRQWMIATANLINGIPVRDRIPCGDDVKSCLTAAVSSGADIVIVPMFVNSYDLHSRRWIFEMSPESGVLVVPKGKPFTILEMFLKPFTGETWIVLLILLCLMEFIHCRWQAIFKNDPILLLVCGLERFCLHHATRREKLIFLPLIIIFFLMSNVYESKLLSFLTEKPSHPDFETIHEVLDSGLKIKYDHFSKATLAKNSLLAPFLVNDTSDYLDVDGSYVYYKDSTQAKSVVQLMINYDFKLRRPKYVVLRERIASRIYAYMIYWQSPLRDAFYFTYQALWESGLFGKWRMQFWEQLASKERAEYRDQILEATEEIMLGIEDLVPAWIALGVGLVLGGVAIIGELGRAVFAKKLICCTRFAPKRPANDEIKMHRICW